MKIILRIVVLALVIMALPYVLSGVSVDGFYSALITALILSIINLVVKPIISLLTLPVNMLTLGLLGLAINGALLWFVASFVDGFHVASFLPAFFAALIISAVNWLLSKF